MRSAIPVIGNSPAPSRAGIAAIALAFTLAVACVFATPTRAQYAAPPPQEPAPTFRLQETIDTGHFWFGQASVEVASAVEYVYARYGEPTGYIVGQEAGGALFGGLRYGEGELRMKSGEVLPVFWQGPSIGFDIGADGSRLLVLVYNLNQAGQIFDRYGGPSGLAYVAGGVGVSFNTSRDDVILATIRTGVGLRIGVNLGYLRITQQPTWNPF